MGGPGTLYRDGLLKRWFEPGESEKPVLKGIVTVNNPLSQNPCLSRGLSLVCLHEALAAPLTKKRGLNPKGNENPIFSRELRGPQALPSHPVF